MLLSVCPPRWLARPVGPARRICTTNTTFVEPRRGNGGRRVTPCSAYRWNAPGTDLSVGWFVSCSRTNVLSELDV